MTTTVSNTPLSNFDVKTTDSGGVITPGVIQHMNIDSVATATLSNVASSAASVSLLVANTARKMASFFNDSIYSCYLKYGTTASATSFTVKILPGGFYELPIPVYTGAIDGIWDTANGNMRITEH